MGLSVPPLLLEYNKLVGVLLRALGNMHPKLKAVHHQWYGTKSSKKAIKAR